MKIKDLIEGQMYGHLTYIQESTPHLYPSGQRHRYGMFRCDCGIIKEIKLQHVANGRIKACGCQQGKRDIGEVK